MLRHRILGLSRSASARTPVLAGNGGKPGNRESRANGGKRTLRGAVWATGGVIYGFLGGWPADWLYLTLDMSLSVESRGISLSLKL